MARKNIEKAPREEEEKTGAELEEPSAEDILIAAMSELEPAEKIRAAETEAYQEKEKKESAERMKLQAEDRHEQALNYARGDGASLFMAIYANRSRVSELASVGTVSTKRKNEIIADAEDYLQDNFGLSPWRQNHFRERAACVGIGREDIKVDFGVYEREISDKISGDSYPMLMRQIKEGIAIDWADAKEEGLDEVQTIWESTDRLAIQKHLEGFATAALEHNDLVSSVDAFIEADLIRDNEIARKVAEKMRELAGSEDPKDRANAIDAKKILKKFFQADSQKKEE